LDFYADADLVKITRRSAALLGISIGDKAAVELAKRSRGTPRIVNRLLKRVRDYSQVRADGNITTETVGAALQLEGVDEMGLTDLDRRYLNTIIKFYHGGPVGIEAIAATLQEESDTLVDIVEPYLLKIGFIIRTSSGRKASEASFRHLGFKVQTKMFS
jgi:Holliday junction DNA helicase RuvB